MPQKPIVALGAIITLAGCLLLYDSVVVYLLHALLGGSGRQTPGFDAKELLIGAAFAGAGIVTLLRQRRDAQNRYSLPIGLVLVGLFGPLVAQVELHDPWWFTSNSDVTIMSGDGYGDEIRIRDRYVRYRGGPGLAPADAPDVQPAPPPVAVPMPQPVPIPAESAAPAESARQPDTPSVATTVAAPAPALRYEQNLPESCGDGTTLDKQADALVDQGIEALSAPGGSARAEALFRQALVDEPRHLVAYNRLGWLLLHVRNDAAGAVQLQSAAVALFPECDWLRFDLGSAYSALRNYAAAREQLQLAIALAADPPPSYFFNLGNAYLNDGLPADAVELYQTALAMDPAHKEAETNLVHAYIRLGKADLLLARFHDDADNLRRIGITYAEQHGDGGAIAFFQRVVELEDDAEAHYNLAVSYGRLGRFEQSEQHARRALALEPDHAGAKVALRLSREGLRKGQ